MKQYKYALFDMDGTMLNSMQYWSNIVGEWTQGRMQNTEELCKKLETMTVGSGLKYIQETYAGTPAGTITWQGLFDLMDKHYREDVTIKEGVVDFLEYLKNKGIRMGILTGTPQPLADLALAVSGLDQYFQFVLTPNEFPRGKKENEIFEEGLRLLGEDAGTENTLFFEDALYSMETAKKMGFYVIGLEDESDRRDRTEIIKICDEYWKKMEIRGVCTEL